MSRRRRRDMGAGCRHMGALRAVGLLTGASAGGAAAAALTVAMLIALPFAASPAGLRRMIERMGATERPGEVNGPIGAAAAPWSGVPSGRV